MRSACFGRLRVGRLGFLKTLCRCGGLAYMSYSDEESSESSALAGLFWAYLIAVSSLAEPWNCGELTMLRKDSFCMAYWQSRAMSKAEDRLLGLTSP